MAVAPYAVAARALLRETVIDAAASLLLERPWREVTMAQIAVAAGVSRQTLYNEFGSRDGVAQAVVLREEEVLVAEVSAVLERNGADVVVALERAFQTFLELAAERPVARHVLSGGDEDGLIALVTTRGRPVLEAASGRLAEIIVRQWPTLRRDGAELLADVLVRLAISYATLPAGAGDDDSRAPSAAAARAAGAVTRLLGPYAERALGS